MQLFTNFILMIFLINQNDIVSEATCASAKRHPTPSQWIVQEANICYGAKDDSFATFTFKQDCRLYALRLRHVSGELICNTAIEKWYYWSRWGCFQGNRQFHTCIVSPDGELWFPEKKEGSNGYKLNGFNTEDDVLIIKKFQKGNFTTGDELQIWHCDDKQSNNEGDNGGKHCIDVDASCLI